MMTAISRLPSIANESAFHSKIFHRLESTRILVGYSSNLRFYQSRLYATKKSKNSTTNRDASKNKPGGDSAPLVGGKGGRAKQSLGLSYLYRRGGPLSPGERHNNSSVSIKKNKFTKAEEARIDSTFALLKKILPTELGKVVDKTRQDLKRDGWPPEFDAMFDKLKNGGHLDIEMMAKMFKITTQTARSYFEKHREEIEDISGGKKEVNNENAKAGGQSKMKASGQGSNKKKNSENKSGDFNFFELKLDAGTLITGGIGVYLLYRMIIPSENQKEISWQEFRATFFDKGLVDKLTVINHNRVRVDLHREATGQLYPDSPAQYNKFYYYFSIGSVEAFERRLDEAQNELMIPNSERIPVTYTTSVSWLSTLISVGPTLLLIGALTWLSRRATRGGVGGGGVFGMMKSRAKKFNHETDVQIKFKDVAGMDEAKAEIMEFVSFLKEPGQYQRLGAKIPRGAILSGPPGTGKTLLAKATAGESRVPFFSVSGSEFVEMFVGVGPSRVRDLFANARKNTPCIIFIDEIDAIGKARGKGNFGGGVDERESTLNQILTEMDGFNTSEQVVVLAGTNRPDVLDRALLRPGRFDRHIAIDRPTMEGRKQIFAVHLGKIVTNEEMDHLSGRLAALTPGFSGADIANCVNEAALIAARTNAQYVVMTHFEQAIERVVGGLEKKSLVLNPEEKRTVAYHEAGHAICGWFLKHADPLLKVSIIPRGQGALGYAMSLPQGEIYLLSQKHLMDRMAMTLGGRVSEELHFETVTSGASDDFKKVTRLATAMVTQFGMSDKIGHVYFEDGEQNLHKPFAEETARDIDLEVRRIVREAYEKCRSLLVAKKKELGLVAEELLKLEVLTREDLIRLLGQRPFEENKEFAKYFDGTGGGKSAPPPPPTESESNGYPIPTPI